MSEKEYTVTYQSPYGFTAVDNPIIDGLDNLLAIGLYTYMRRFSEGWKFHKSHLMKKFSIGRNVLNRTLRVLKFSNLVKRVKTRNKKGQFESFSVKVFGGENFNPNYKQDMINNKPVKKDEDDISYPQKNQCTEIRSNGENIHCTQIRSPANGKLDSLYINKIINKEKDNNNILSNRKNVDNFSETEEKRSTDLVDDFEPDESNVRLAISLGHDPNEEKVRCMSWYAYHRKEPTTTAKWQGRFKRWLENTKPVTATPWRQPEKPTISTKASPPPKNIPQMPEIEQSNYNPYATHRPIAQKSHEMKSTLAFWGPGHESYDRLLSSNMR